MNRWIVGSLAVVLLALPGCTIKFAQRSPWDIQQLAELSEELDQFKTLARLNEGEANQLRHAQQLLDKGLNVSSDVSVGFDERGLVTRVVDRILFDSGKAKLRFGAGGVFDRIARVLSEVPDQPVGIEGHTDNEPIKVSSWASNKELSLARARTIADYLIKRGVAPARFSTIGYGQSRPISSNDTPEGRQKNRRVEIIILPQASGESYQAEAERLNMGVTYTK